MPNDQHAFPHDINGEFGLGMTLRDYFAAKALQALTDQYFRFNGACFGHDHLYRNLPAHAYQMADAMLVARDKGRS